MEQMENYPCDLYCGKFPILFMLCKIFLVIYTVENFRCDLYCGVRDRGSEVGDGARARFFQADVEVNKISILVPHTPHQTSEPHIFFQLSFDGYISFNLEMY